MVTAARYVKLLTVKVTQVDASTLHVADTGWVPFIASSAYWRMVNTTLSCTGNVTHYLPSPEFVMVERPWGAREEVLVGAIVAVAAALTVWIRSRAGFSPLEHRIAVRKGYTLLTELGAGRSGKVYKGELLFLLTFV